MNVVEIVAGYLKTNGFEELCGNESACYQGV